MKKTWLFTGALVAAGALIASGLVLEQVHAQQQPQNAGLRIAVIEVNEVFKQYEKFKNMQGQLSSDLDAKQGELKRLEEEARSLVQALQEVKNPEDRDRIEKQIAERKFDFEKARRNHQESLMKEEANMYATCYQEMTDLLATYCKQNGIHLVLRLREQSETQDVSPQVVLSNIQRSVVYHHPNLDLTKVIASGMNQQLAVKTQR